MAWNYVKTDDDDFLFFSLIWCSSLSCGVVVWDAVLRLWYFGLRFAVAIAIAVGNQHRIAESGLNSNIRNYFYWVTLIFVTSTFAIIFREWHKHMKQGGANRFAALNWILSRWTDSAMFCWRNWQKFPINWRKSLISA